LSASVVNFYAANEVHGIYTIWNSIFDPPPFLMGGFDETL